MVKPEWGTKRTCPRCSTRFFDLGQEEPVVCISCGNEWIPEPVLKSKQPLPFHDAKAGDKSPNGGEADDEDTDDVLLDDDDDEADSVADVSLDDDDADLSDVVEKKPESSE